jgi:predicted O-methyltransferase YrrM
MYRFTVNFQSDNRTTTNIVELVKTYGIPSAIIEVGAYEGYTTFWLSDILTEHNKDLKIYAVDPHVGSIELTDVNFNEIQSNFTHNLNANIHKNVEYVQKFSKDGLVDLINKGVKAELIYIDGDHRASTVLTDLVLSWELLKLGGVIICDDSVSWKYKDKHGTASPHMSPRMAIEMFIACNWEKIEPIELPHSGQTAFMKIAE